MLATVLVTSMVMGVSGCTYANSTSVKPSLPTVAVSSSAVKSETSAVEVTTVESTSSETSEETTRTTIVVKATPIPKERKSSETTVVETTVETSAKAASETGKKKSSKKATEETPATTASKSTEKTTAPSEHAEASSEPSEPQEKVTPTEVPEEPATSIDPYYTYETDPNHTYYPPVTSLVINTPTPTPVYKPFDTSNAKSVAKSAIRQAIVDVCGDRVVIAEDPYGIEEPVRYTFAFDDGLISNEQKRAETALSNGELSHQAISGAFVPDAESCCSILAMYDSSSSAPADGWGYMGWPKNTESHPESYEDLYTCMYNAAYMLVTVHCRAMALDSDYVHFGYGIAMKPSNYGYQSDGDEITCYEIYVYIGAELYYEY